MLLTNCTINVGIKEHECRLQLLDWTWGSFHSGDCSVPAGSERHGRWSHRFQGIEQIMCSEGKLYSASPECRGGYIHLG